jgi:predicted GH43/DUF377 family glycosyl hydrolase
MLSFMTSYLSISGLLRCVLVATTVLAGLGCAGEIQKGWVRGRVLENRGGSPIPGAEVELFSGTTSGSTFQTVTDDAGAYSIRVDVGDYTVAASKEGYITTLVPVVVAAESDSMVDLKLDAVGSRWFKYDGSPLLDVGASGSWDSLYVRGPWVVRDGNIYKMWYVGTDGALAPRIGYATSPDGLKWTKYQNPVLSRGGAGDWDEYSLDGVAIAIVKETVKKEEKDDEVIRYRMWYTGTDSSIIPHIGYAESKDGTAWTKAGMSQGGINLTDVTNPILNVGRSGEFDDEGVGQPCVLYDPASASYKMWYVGYHNSSRRIGYAVSSDGLSWEKKGEVGFNDGLSGMNRFYPAVISDGSLYRMWYMTDSGLGYAVSEDGQNWSVQNMSISGLKRSWDSQGMGDFSVLKEGTQYKMWYDGSDGQVSRIGYATSP